MAIQGQLSWMEGPRWLWLLLTLPVSPPHAHIAPSRAQLPVLGWLGRRQFSRQAALFHTAEPLHRLFVHSIRGSLFLLFCLNYSCFKIQHVKFKHVKLWWPEQGTYNHQGTKPVMGSRVAGQVLAITHTS